MGYLLPAANPMAGFPTIKATPRKVPITLTAHESQMLLAEPAQHDYRAARSRVPGHSLRHRHSCQRLHRPLRRLRRGISSLRSLECHPDFVHVLLSFLSLVSRGDHRPLVPLRPNLTTTTDPQIRPAHTGRSQTPSTPPTTPAAARAECSGRGATSLRYARKRSTAASKGLGRHYDPRRSTFTSYSFGRICPETHTAFNPEQPTLSVTTRVVQHP
jgi:hypothetical protein